MCKLLQVVYQEKDLSSLWGFYESYTCNIGLTKPAFTIWNPLFDVIFELSNRHECGPRIRGLPRFLLHHENYFCSQLK